MGSPPPNFDEPDERRDEDAEVDDAPAPPTPTLLPWLVEPEAPPASSTENSVSNASSCLLLRWLVLDVGAEEGELAEAGLLAELRFR